MTLEELQIALAEINRLVERFQTSVALEKYYAEDIVMIEGDGTITAGKENCRQGRKVFFDEMLVEFRESKLIGQDIAVSADKDYDFVVISNWYIDILPDLKGTGIPRITSRIFLLHRNCHQGYAYPVLRSLHRLSLSR
jgi:hypothetical protein